MFKDKTILYIVHNYNSFQKDPIEEIAKNFKKVYVLVRYKPISKIAKYIPIKWLYKYSDKYVIDLKDLPSNVSVIKTPVWYLPFGVFYKWLGELHFRAVDKFIKREQIKFDLIHAHFIWSSGYVGIKLKEKYHVPLVITAHGFDVYLLPFKSRDWEERTKFILRNADIILPVSHANRESLQKIGIVDSNMMVLENGFNSEIFHPMNKGKIRKSLGLDEKAPILVTIGSLEEVKAHKYLIKAVKNLKRKDSNICCYIIGAGSLQTQTELLIKELHLEKNVYLLGHLSHNEVNKWINSCDLFVMSSLREGLPVSMLEALGCGKPFIGTKVGGIPEIINSEEYGILVEPMDQKALNSAIEIALKKKWDNDKIANYGKRFTIKSAVNRTLEVYSKLFEKDNY